MRTTCRPPRTLVDMSYDSKTRDRYRLAVRATTATVAAGAMTATGWVAGAAAQDQAKVTAEKRAAQAAEAARLAQTPRTVVRERPATTRVTTRYITAARSSDPVGNGGDVNSDSGSDGGGDGGSSAPAQNNSAPAPQPPPPPPPAPSNGS